MKQKFWIDSHKCATGMVVLGLMAWHHAWDNVVAWTYLALHGTYGLLWVLKSRFFGDKSWEQEASLRLGLTAWVGLSLYWVSPWLIVTGRAGKTPPWLLAACVALYASGVFLHFASDMQKYVMLKHCRGTLITEGLWGIVRNPNYLGELFIYLSFTLLPLHWFPPLVLLTFVCVLWVPNMLKKDRSLSRYPEFAQYKAHTKLFIPWVI